MRIRHDCETLNRTEFKFFGAIQATF